MVFVIIICGLSCNNFWKSWSNFIWMSIWFHHAGMFWSKSSDSACSWITVNLTEERLCLVNKYVFLLTVWGCCVCLSFPSVLLCCFVIAFRRLFYCGFDKYVNTEAFFTTFELLDNWLINSSEFQPHARVPKFPTQISSNFSCQLVENYTIFILVLK